MFSAERLVFEGRPVLKPPLKQERPFPTVTEGEIVDTVAVCPDLTEAEKARLADLIKQAKAPLAPEAARVWGKYVDGTAAELAERSGISLEAARRIAERKCGGVLLPHVVLPFDDGDLEGRTVHDVLADPDHFVGATLADPVEGTSYGRCKAKVLRGHDGRPFINSFAHGGTRYELKHDASTIEPAMRAKEAEAHRVLVRMLPEADLEEDAAQQLRELASELSRVPISVIKRMIKARLAEQEQKHAAERTASDLAKRAKGRIPLRAPRPDDERTPIVRKLDDVLSKVAVSIPPLRDFEGHPVAIRVRPPSKLHVLTSASANNEEDESSRLAAPAMPLITRHNPHSLTLKIERYVMHYTEDKKGNRRPVTLHKDFIDTYAAYPDSIVPLIESVVTAPLVLPSGELLVKEGYDRDLQVAFMIPPELCSWMPKGTPPKHDVANALDYLANEWLCDVSTDFLGKCTLIALMLTIIERSLLSQRPGFFVTAGKRGGGKTTALLMAVMAATGSGAASQPWSWKQEERRKALFSSLLEAPPVIVWDNIPTGSEISCPFLETVLTNDVFNDRILGKTKRADAKTHTVMAFTGNNITPIRDLASRSLKVAIVVDRPDAENRPFRHADPLAWTIQNRGHILQAAYTILLGNPRLRQRPEDKPQAKTRFKIWYDLVGSALEYAADALCKDEWYKTFEKKTAVSIDFGAAIAAVEAEDDESNGDAQVLDIFHRKWRENPFTASLVVSLIAAAYSGSELAEEDKSALRACFDPSGRMCMEISSKSVGKRMASLVNSPFFVGDYVMELKNITSASDREAKRPHTYRVQVKLRR